jgi:hypothetical protein
MINSGKAVVLLASVMACCTSCSAPAANVTEVLNHSLCNSLPEGISRVEFADLAKIRGTKLLDTAGGSGPESEAESLGDVLLVAVSNGSQPTPGYGFELQSVDGSSAEVRLQYRWLTPAPDAVMAQMLTSPCSVVQIQSAQPPTAISAWLDGVLLDKLVLTE